MNKGMLGLGIILLSALALVLLNVLSNFSTGSELDYYLVKETTDAAITDALDTAYSRNCGLVRMDKEKFIESFIRRFADSVESTRTYKVGFYDINEIPPKVSVKVDSSTTVRFNSKNDNSNGDLNISTSYDAILETNYKKDPSFAAATKNAKSDYCKTFDVIDGKVK